MRGTKPDQQTVSEAEQALSNLRIEVPPERATEQTRAAAQEQSTKPSQKPEVVKRFEAIIQQELSGTSFSRGLDRRARAQERLAQRVAKKLAAERPLNTAKSIRGAKGERAKVFAGTTILDKLVSFLAFLIKSLERKLLGGIRRFFPGYRQQLLKQQQQLQALTAKKNQTRQAAKNGKGGAALSGR